MSLFYFLVHRVPLSALYICSVSNHLKLVLPGPNALHFTALMVLFSVPYLTHIHTKKLFSQEKVSKQKQFSLFYLIKSALTTLFLFGSVVQF